MIEGSIIGVTEGDTRRLDYSSYNIFLYIYMLYVFSRIPLLTASKFESFQHFSQQV